MRIPDSRINNVMLQSLRTGNTNVAKVMDQVSSGNRITRISDDPSATLKLANIESERRSIGQYQQNIDALSTKLLRQEIYVSGMDDLLLEIRDLVLYAANDTKSQADYAGIKTEIESLKNSLYAEINTQDGSGNYLFSGSRTDVPAVSYQEADPVLGIAATYVLNANDDSVPVVVGEGLKVNSNISATQLLAGDANDVFDRLDQYIDDLDLGVVPSSETEIILNSLDAFRNNVGGALTTYGGKQNYLSTLKDNHQSNELFMDRVKVEIEQLDIAEASVRLNSYMNSLEATQITFKKIANLNLFDRL